MTEKLRKGPVIWNRRRKRGGVDAIPAVLRSFTFAGYALITYDRVHGGRAREVVEAVHIRNLVQR